MSDDDDLTIPDFLKIDEETRRKARLNTRSRLYAVPVDPIRAHQDELRARWAETRKAKRTAALTAHLERHAGERWAAPKGTKTKMWLRDAKAADAHHAKLVAEFEAEERAARKENAA